MMLYNTKYITNTKITRYTVYVKEMKLPIYDTTDRRVFPTPVYFLYIKVFITPA